MKTLIFISLFCFVGNSFSQDNWMAYPSDSNANIKKGKVTYKEDPRVQKMIDFLAAPAPPDQKTVIDGYRVQIFFNNDKKIIDEQRTKFSQTYPEIPTYVRYEAPNYSIKVGNFRTELQAAKYRYLFSGDFPTSIIQQDKIELPNLDQQEPVNTTAN